MADVIGTKRKADALAWKHPMRKGAGITVDSPNCVEIDHRNHALTQNKPTASRESSVYVSPYATSDRCPFPLRTESSDVFTCERRDAVELPVLGAGLHPNLALHLQEEQRLNSLKEEPHEINGDSKRRKREKEVLQKEGVTESAAEPEQNPPTSRVGSDAFARPDKTWNAIMYEILADADNSTMTYREIIQEVKDRYPYYASPVFAKVLTSSPKNPLLYNPAFYKSERLDGTQTFGLKPGWVLDRKSGKTIASGPLSSPVKSFDVSKARSQPSLAKPSSKPKVLHEAQANKPSPALQSSRHAAPRTNQVITKDSGGHPMYNSVSENLELTLMRSSDGMIRATNFDDETEKFELWTAFSTRYAEALKANGLSTPVLKTHDIVAEKTTEPSTEHCLPSASARSTSETRHDQAKSTGSKMSTIAVKGRKPTKSDANVGSTPKRQAPFKPCTQM